jgi:small basic protein (TIGR04137 family)
MSLDRSLKTAGNLTRHRNVLNRAERIVKLAEKGKFDPAAGDPLHLPKVGNRKVAAGGKTAKKDAAAEGTAAAPAAPAAAAAKPAAKAGAKPGGKGK